ncbi:MAG TPA: protein phosphatase 2C domain-containing protein [Caulobacteraceae bacterium]
MTTALGPSHFTRAKSGERQLAARVQPCAVARSHVGTVRSRNEDRWLARPDVGLWAVADGMGGHQSGELASGLLVEALERVTLRSSGHALLNAAMNEIRFVNSELRARAQEIAPGAVIGSTIVALVVFDGHCAVVWAGDSRAYRLRCGHLEIMTSDHRVVQELIDQGQLTPAEAARHPRANVVTRAVGGGERLDLDTRYEAVEDGDVFLLASDGLTDVVRDEEIAELLVAGTMDQAADELLALSLSRGARDNITFVLVTPM